MSLTFGQAKSILAPYQGKAGKIPNNAQLHEFAYKILQYLLISGAHGSERKFSLTAVNGYLTAPYELDVPLKVQVNGKIGTVGSKWFEFRSGNDLMQNGSDASKLLLEDPNNYCTVYDAPDGAQIGVKGNVDEDADASIIISGKDPTGRAIFTNHKGAEIAGEYLEVRKNQITWSNVAFGSIDSIVKTRTNGYVTLFWRHGNRTGFLADYSPIEEVPSYRRFKLNIPNCPSPAKITILGRIRLKPAYADNDLIPFDNAYVLEVAGQQAQAQNNDQLNEAQSKDQFLQQLVNREAQYKNVNNGQPLEVFYPLSGGTIRGIND